MQCNMQQFIGRLTKYSMCGMNGRNMWPSTDFVPPLTLLRRTVSGKVNRIKDPSEWGAKHIVSKVGKKFCVVYASM